MNELQDHIETRIAELDPRVELIALEQRGPEALRLYLDHPEGVTLDLCESVTHQLVDLQDEYALEVSSPGLDRPLTKPEHFARFEGSIVRVRTNEPVGGQRNFVGLLADAGERSMTIEEPDGRRSEIQFDAIRRSNLVPEPSEVAE